MPSSSEEFEEDNSLGDSADEDSYADFDNEKGSKRHSNVDGFDDEYFDDDQHMRDLIVQALGFKSAHIPGNTRCQDYFQYVIANNHTVFGILCFHPLHPLRYGVRIIALVGSLAMSLGIYNLIFVYLGSVSSPSVVKFLNTTTRVIDAFSGADVTSERLVVTLLGAPLLTVFDLAIWGLAALPCCLPGHVLGGCNSWRWIGTVLVVIVIIFVSIASFWLIIVRTAFHDIEDDLNGTAYSGGLTDDIVHFGDALEETLSGSVKTTDFLIGALIQFAITMLVMRIVGSSIIFFFKYPMSLKKYQTKMKGLSNNTKKTHDTDTKFYESDSSSWSDYSVYEGSDSERSLDNFSDSGSSVDS